MTILRAIPRKIILTSVVHPQYLAQDMETSFVQNITKSENFTTQHSKLPLSTCFIRKNHNANQSLLKSIYKGPQIDFDSLIAALNFTEGIRFKSTIKTINMQLLLVSYFMVNKCRHKKNRYIVL